MSPSRSRTASIATPRFSFDAIAALIGRMPDEHVVFRPGAIEADADFDASFVTSDKPDVHAVLARLEATGSYVYARNPECAPVYRPVIEGRIAEIAASLRHLDAPITWYSAYLFVSAQGSVPP